MGDTFLVESFLQVWIFGDGWALFLCNHSIYAVILLYCPFAVNLSTCNTYIFIYSKLLFNVHHNKYSFLLIKQWNGIMMHLAWCSCCRNRNLRVRSEGHLTHSGTFDSMIFFFFFHYESYNKNTTDQIQWNSFISRDVHKGLLQRCWFKTLKWFLGTSPKIITILNTNFFN